MLICDPACGTGGFLTEAYKVLASSYSSNNQLNDENLQEIRKNTFWGFDNEAKSVARTKLNMFLVGDGHNHIYENDSLIDWKPSLGWDENKFDYILANPPMGLYKGDADVNNYEFTNEKRYELFFLEKIIKATKYGGSLAIVINDGTLETPSRMMYRKRLLEHCDIQAIIGLTKFAFAPYTKEKTYVLFMQKKQKQNIGMIQTNPIWHYIIDYDGYANSDKRYKTKYHDDLAELESVFEKAVGLIKLFNSDRVLFEDNRSIYERKINKRESEEGLFGYKYKFVDMEDINDGNYYNLLSEKHLRPYIYKKITKAEFCEKVNTILEELNSLHLG